MKHKKQSSTKSNSIKISKSKIVNKTLKKREKKQNISTSKLNLCLKQKRIRQENSLDELTKDFIQYVKETKNVLININDVVMKLKVKKRRIYDITNVLEGINKNKFNLNIRYRIY